MTNWWEKDSVAVAENTPTVSTKNFWEKDSDLVEDLAGPEPQKRNIYAVGGMGGYDPGITKETAPQVNFGALSEKAGIPEIGTAIKEMISPTTQYTKKEADQAASELGKRIKLYGEYFTTLGGRIDLEALTAHVQAGEIGGTWAPSLPIDKEALKRPVIAGKKGRQALSEKAEELAGFGPALIPSAAELGQLAIEWGVVVPALFKASGATNEAVAQIPKVKKGLGALAKLGGIEKVAAKHPRLYDTVKGTLNAILKGSEVGTTMGALETVGEEMEPGEIIRHVGKEAVKMGLVAGAFHTASEVDTRIWTNTFRKNLLSSHRNRFDRLVYQIDRMGTGGDIKSAILKNMPSITPAELEAIGNISPNMRKAAAYKSLANKKTLELKAIDDVTAAAEAQLRAMKAGKIYREGQELIEDPVRAAKRISRSGLENVKTYPKGPAGLKKGLGKTEPFIEMPTTRTGEIRETITGKSRTSTKTPSGRRPPQSAAELGLEVGQKAITGFPKSDFLPTGVDQAIPPTRGGVQHPTGQVLPGGSAESTKLETAKQRAAERLSRKVTRAGTGRAEGPLIGQLYTHAEDLIEQAQAEQDPGKRKSLIDELEQTDSIVNQISRENLEGKSVEQLSKMAKRFGVEVPKGADKTAIIGLLAGKADLSQIQKTDSGYRIEIPIAATKAGRAMEVHEFDSYAEAAYFLEDREGEGGVTAAVSGPKPTQPTSTTKITTEKPTTETLVEPSDATQPVPMVGKGGIASPATVKPSPRASTEKVEGRVQTDGGAEQSWETEGEVKIKGTPQEKKLVEDFAEGLTTQEWKEEYRKGELPHWMTDLEPSPLSKELNDDLEKGGIKQANILEIGTGNGRDSIFLAKRGHTTTGIDVAEQAVSAAKKNAGKLKNVTFEKGNAEKLKYPDESFDAVFSIAALHSSLLDESLAEINRVLKPGGIAKIHQYTKIETAGKTIHYWKPEQIKELAKKAGFSVLESHTTTKSDFVEVEGVREKIKQDSDIIVYTIKKEGLAPAAVTQGKGEGPITKAEKNALREKGYKVSQILKMTPGQARELLLEVPAEEVAKIEKPKGVTKSEKLKVGDMVRVVDKPSTAHLMHAAGKTGEIIDIQIWRGKPNSWAIQFPDDGEFIVDDIRDLQIPEGKQDEITEEEAITEPKPSIEEQQGKARPDVSFEPTGKLDPTKPEDAAKIIEEHRQFLRGKDKNLRIANSGIYETEWDKEAHDFVITKVIYSHEQVDQAYRTVQTQIESPQDDVSLFAMPGKEKELGAIGAKMSRMKKPSDRKAKQPSIGNARQLPKAKTKKEDFIYAIQKASSKETSRYAISGLLVEGDNLVATDGRRLFTAKGKWGKDGIYTDNTSLRKGVLGKADKTGMKFTKWQDIIPDISEENAITISINAINNELPMVWRRLHQAASMTSEESKGVLVILNKDGSLGFAASAPEIGHTEINVQPGGKILGAANPSFLIDALAFHAIRGDSPIEFYFPYPDRPILTTGPRGETRTLTMPVNAGQTSEELQKALESRTKAIAGEKPKPTGGGTGGSSAAAASSQSTGGGYGTIASSEKSTFANTTNKKRFRDAAPDKKSLRAVDELLKGVSPASRGGARGGARVLRKNLGQLAHETTVAHEALRKAHHAFTFMSRADIYEFIDRMETGRAQSSLKLDDMAKSFRKMLDGRRDTVRGLGKGHLENFYESYFPHIWKDPASAKKAIMQIFGKRRLEGSKSFLKKRSIMTIKEGRGYGLELVSENPVDLVLLKVYEMDRYIMAQRIIQDLKARGLIKFVYSRSQSPDGYVKVNDNAFTVYMPPEITKKEAYDQILVDQLMDTARSMGIDTDRFVAIGGKRWGYAQYEGSPETGPHKIRTKYAGPESVLAHEIGHVLGYKYNLFETIRRKKDGSYRDITKGEKAGGQRFVPTKDAVTHRRTIDKEWRDLADARYKGQQVSPGYQKYVRKAREKEAVLLEALIHAPDEFKSVAPTLHGLFVKFLNSHSELRPILDMKPSLVLGQSDAKIKVPGFTTLGHYYAPEPVGKILNNYLSPGLRNSENKIIATGYNLLRMSGNILNQAQLALSLFHGLNVTTDMIASTYGMGIRQMTIKGQRLHGVGRIISSPASPLLRLWSGIRLRRAYKQQIDTITNPRLQAMVRAVVLADGRDRMDPFYYNQAIKALKGTVSDLIHGSPKQKIAGVFKLPVQTFGATLEVLAKPLMEWYVPTGKLGLFAMMAESEMKRAESGQITNEQLHERLISSWDSVDNRMGQLVYDNLFWNKTFKDVSMMAVRSVGWNLGSWREYGGVPIDILGTKGRLERGDVLLSQKMSYTIGAVTLYGVLGAAIGYILTGKPPEEPKDYFFPKTGNKNNDGSDERLSLPTYAKDWFAYGTQPVKTVKNKTHPLWGLLTDVVSNKDFFSTQIRNPKDLISQQLLDVAEYIGREFLPLSARNYEKMSTADPGKQGKNAWVSITGITSAPSYITRSPAQKLMYRYIIENIPDKTKNKEQTELYRYRRDIKNRLRKGDPVDKDEVIKRIGAKSWLQLKADARKEPFIESFSRLSLNHCLYVYAIASPAEKRAARTILKGKYSRAEKITPEMKLMYNVLMLEGAD